jgi:predicted flap endonuclease-1-like 5' DNA nuclease
MNVYVFWLFIAFICGPILGYAIAVVVDQNRANESEKRVRKVQEELEQSRKHLEERAGVIAEHEATIATLNEEAVRNEQAAKTLTAEVKTLTDSAGKLETTVKEKEDKIKQLEEAAAQAGALEGTLTERTKEVESLRAQIAKLEAAAAPPEPVQPDDLTRIEGIGPKVSGALQENGIKTFKALADATPDQLVDILTKAGIGKITVPDTWPEQAGLAVEGKWDELQTLQDELQGGRRV